MKNGNEPAFPTDSAAQVGPQTWHFEGLTKREYFAALAMQGLNARIDHLCPNKGLTMEQTIAKWAVEQADALLAELNALAGTKEAYET